MAYSSEQFPATFVAGDTGRYRIDRVVAVKGEGLLAPPRLDVLTSVVAPERAAWSLSGVAGHARYVERSERGPLDLASPRLDREEATLAVLIPIRKSAAWWRLPQDERREIFERRSHHIEDSMKYLPRIARRLYHARELGQPFDFLTWFELAPEHAPAFDELLSMLRSREEWTYVEREVEVWLRRAP